jgi:hypothetical protein
VRLIQEIGSYAGIAAIPGLAILSALYFSQARDVRRLRDWAGRAPERSAEAAQGGRVTARPAPQTAAAQTGAATPAAPAAPAAPATAAPATAAGTAAAAAGAGAAAAGGGGGGTATATRPATAAPPGTHPPVPRVHTGGQTTILGTGGSENGGDPWYRRAADRLPAARYLAIALVGILVIGGGIAYGITQLSHDNSSSSSGQPSAAGGTSPSAKKSSKSSSPSINPKDVTVAILNGTTVNGLASQVGTKLQQLGFQVGNEDNSLQGQVNESVVMFKPGANREAALVRHRLDIQQTEPADQQSLSQSGGADVIVVLGADKAQAGTP